MIAFDQIGLFAIEAVVVCALLLWFFRLRHRFGLSLLYVTLGSFQHLQTELAASMYVQVAPGLFISPGSAILFTAALFAILLVYIREDAIQARSLIVGVVAANLALTLVIFMANLHMSSPLTVASEYLSDHNLLENIKAFIIGTGMLIIDVLLIIVLYEFFYRVFPRQLFLRILSSMCIVVSIDTLVFVAGNFLGQPDFEQILISGLVGKIGAAAIYSVMLTAFLRLYRVRRRRGEQVNSKIHDVFHILTYRQRYDLLKDELIRDHLTNLFNRRFFDDNLQRELRRARRLDHRLNLVIYDLDLFKKVNDTRGHAIGDKVLICFADAMRQAFRAADITCRYGGEEFVVIMPDSSIAAATAASNRLAQLYIAQCTRRGLNLENPTFTAGIASYPDDGALPEELLEAADSRLYEGKRAGRNQVVAVDMETALSA